MSDDDTIISEIGEAVRRLQRVLDKYSIGPVTAISVSIDTGMRLKTLRHSGMVYFSSPHDHKSPCHAITICGVDFEMRKEEPG